MPPRTLPPSRYAVTYVFSDDRRGEHDTAMARIDRTVAELQREGIAITCLGTTDAGETRASGAEMTVGYISPSKAAIGQLNYRTGLPASGAPQRITEVRTDGRRADLEPDSKPSTSQARRSRRRRHLESPL